MSGSEKIESPTFVRRLYLFLRLGIVHCFNISWFVFFLIF